LKIDEKDKDDEEYPFSTYLAKKIQEIILISMDKVIKKVDNFH
jgi:hypothetical protein